MEQDPAEGGGGGECTAHSHIYIHTWTYICTDALSWSNPVFQNREELKTFTSPMASGSCDARTTCKFDVCVLMNYIYLINYIYIYIQTYTHI